MIGIAASATRSFRVVCVTLQKDATISRLIFRLYDLHRHNIMISLIGVQIAQCLGSLTTDPKVCGLMSLTWPNFLSE